MKICLKLAFRVFEDVLLFLGSRKAVLGALKFPWETSEQDAKFHTLPGPWSLVLGPWSLVPGPWSLVPGPCLVLGPWSLVPGPWSLDPGPGPCSLDPALVPGPVVLGPWSMVPGSCSLVLFPGPWSLVLGPRARGFPRQDRADFLDKTARIS